MAAELTTKLAVCSILERGFDDILLCEWIQNGVKNTKKHKKRRFFNVVLTTSLYMNGFKPVSELTVRLTFGPTGFHDIVVCEWIQTGVKNREKRRFLNLVLTTSPYVNGFKQVSAAPRCSKRIWHTARLAQIVQKNEEAAGTPP